MYVHILMFIGMCDKSPYLKNITKSKIGGSKAFMKTIFINSINGNMYVHILMSIGLCDKSPRLKNLTKSKTSGSKTCAEVRHSQ